MSLSYVPGHYDAYLLPASRTLSQHAIGFSNEFRIVVIILRLGDTYNYNTFFMMSLSTVATAEVERRHL